MGWGDEKRQKEMKRRAGEKEMRQAIKKRKEYNRRKR